MCYLGSMWLSVLKLEDIRTYLCGNRKNPAERERLMQEKGDNEGLLYNKGINCVM